MKTQVLIFSILFAFLVKPEMVVGQHSATEVEQVVLQVKGVGCNEDVKSIAANIAKLEGVVKCTPLKRGSTTKFEVDYDPELTSLSRIYAAIEDTPGCKNPNKRPYKVKNKG